MGLSPGHWQESGQPAGFDEYITIRTPAFSPEAVHRDNAISVA